MMEKTIIVTGAAGFLGRNVSKYFSSMGWKVYGVGLGDWSYTSYSDWGLEKWVKTEVSLEVLNSLQIEPDVIVHCAGKGSVGFSVTNPEEDYKANVDSLLPALEFVRTKKLKTRIIYPSSAAVYGEKENKPINESDILSPISPYGFHKKMAEELCYSYSTNFGLNISVIRFFSLYGIGLRKQLLWEACKKVDIEKGDKVQFFGTGKEVRDWLNIEDASRLIYELSKSRNTFEVVNGASGKAVRNEDIIQMLIDSFGKKMSVEFNGMNRNGDPKNYWADISKALALDWKPNIDLSEGINEYVKYYKSIK